MYQTGSSFGMNSYYRSPSIVSNINCSSTRANGIIVSTDQQVSQTLTSVVVGMVPEKASFEQSVNANSALKHIDYEQNAKPVSIQLYE